MENINVPEELSSLGFTNENLFGKNCWVCGGICVLTPESTNGKFIVSSPQKDAVVDTLEEVINLVNNCNDNNCPVGDDVNPNGIELQVSDYGNPEDIPLVDVEDEVLEAAYGVMAAYQNANKWLDTVKEVIYTKLDSPFFSSFVHSLAHTMPGRFDKFGDILHTVNIEIPYPSTEELTDKPTDITSAFEIIFSSLDDIKSELNGFIKATDDRYHGMACAAEGLLNDIEEEYPMLYRLRGKWNQCNGNTVEFDKYVMQYVEHKDGLLESVKQPKKAKLILDEDQQCLTTSAKFRLNEAEEAEDNYVGKTAIFTDNAYFGDASDWGYDDSEDDFENDVLAYVGQPCTINCLALEGDPYADDYFEEQYWDITFEDGHTLSAVSGYCLDLTD